MARRIDIELTSTRDDGSWTWRAAGAREPKGVLDGGVLPPSARVGDVLRAEADFTIEGIDIVSVQAPKEAKTSKAETLELIGTRRDEPLVTSTLVAKRGGRPRRDEGDRPRKPGRGPRDRDRGDRDRGDRERGRDRGDRTRDRGERGGHDRGPRERRAPAERRREEAPARPPAKRLRAGRGHRNKMLRDLPEEQRPLAELVLRGGVPALRQALQRQQQLAKSIDQPAVRGEPLLALADQLLPRLKAAEWRDRAEAALRQVDTVDLRDLRSVVSAAESAARDEESRALAEELRTALTARVDREHQQWLDELTTVVQEGRIVRALRLSSRPPKAGAPLPADLANGLAEQATTGLTADVTQERFATLLEAVSFSPVHQRVAATSIPREPTKELLDIVRRVASRVPAVAAQFGVTPRERGGSAARPTPTAAVPAPNPTAPSPPAPSPPAASPASVSPAP